MQSRSVLRRIAIQKGEKTPEFDKQPKILVNRCQCSICKDIIESKNTHDFVQCSCGGIFTDGGTSYLRRGCTEPASIIDLSEFKY